MGIFDKGIKKTNLNFFQKLGRSITGKSRVDEDVLAFRFIRRIRIDQHLIGADIEIKAVGGTVTAYCLSKGDCRRIKQILMDYNATRRSKGIIFS